METKQDKKGASMNNEMFSTRFFQAVEKQLADHPQIGAVLLEGLSVACSRISEFLDGFQEQIQEKCDELKSSNGSRKEKQSVSGKGTQKSQSTQSASAH